MPIIAPMMPMAMNFAHFFQFAIDNMKNITIAIALKIAPAMLNAADVYFPSAISPGIITKSTMSMISIAIPHNVLLMLRPFLFF